MQSVFNVSAHHPSFAGHFPGFPVLPGAILLDELLKAVELARGIDIRHWYIGSAKFFGPVKPLDTLILQHEAASPGLIRFSILASRPGTRLENRKVASGSLLKS